MTLENTFMARAEKTFEREQLQECLKKQKRELQTLQSAQARQNACRERKRANLSMIQE